MKIYKVIFFCKVYVLAQAQEITVDLTVNIAYQSYHSVLNLSEHYKQTWHVEKKHAITVQKINVTDKFFMGTISIKNRDIERKLYPITVAWSRPAAICLFKPEHAQPIYSITIVATKN